MLILEKEDTRKIDDEIIAEIRRSAFLIADFTGHRGGVYFEAGYAMGHGLPVIWTCRKDEMDKLHFDIRQYNCIDWAKPAELADRLQRRIEACRSRSACRMIAAAGVYLCRQTSIQKNDCRSLPRITAPVT